ncbi:cell division ATPase MinD [Halopelagius longus]|uniref:Chromosome partitioning protein n=1 Tax=Halopelagius longus TaxID=1236180 RepID=A0A1H1E2S4_9EURY|nr:cell division ATPase MinD [Halopelagius longus]RDI71578.1 chromosome partitioning protein [Halopelagius longus]SDQ82963.1 septum site-determining protein MinD [Halopelagius longus]
MGRVYAVVSAKGGVGKTTTTTNLAAALAAAGANVAVVDGDLGMANLAGALGVVPTEPTLHDVLAGEADVSEATQEGPHGMAVVPGATDLDAFARADPEGLRAVLSELAERHDYVLLDTGAGLSNDTVVPLTYVDEALLVSTTGRDALGDTEKTRQVAVRLDVPVAGAVLTRVDPEDPNVATVEEQLDAEILQAIPDETVVRRAGDAGEPLTTFAPGSSAAAAYRALAADLTGESVPQPDAAPEATGEADGPTDDGSAAGVETDVSDAETDAPDTGTDAPDAATAAAADDSAAGESDDGDGDSGGEAAERDDGIIVAGDHEADGASDRPDGDDEAAEEGVSADETAESAGEDAADGDSADPLADPTADDAAVGDSSDSDDAAADDDADDGPLVEAAEPEATPDDEQIPFASDSDGDEADDEDDDEDEDDDDGVYTTELGENAEGTNERRDDDKKKGGLFGRFLG